jgi:hypothetical protein
MNLKIEAMVTFQGETIARIVEVRLEFWTRD